MTFTQHRWLSSGWTGGPGYLYLRFRGDLAGSALDTAVARGRTFLDAIKAYFPSGIVYTPDASVTKISETDGRIASVLGIPTPAAAVTGIGSGGFAPVSGFAVVWRTGVLNARRLIVGRTFIVPSSGGVFGATGVMVPATYTAITAAAVALVGTPPVGTDGHLVVWTRPHRGASDGRMTDVATASVNNLGAELRSRRG